MQCISYQSFIRLLYINSCVISQYHGFNFPSITILIALPHLFLRAESLKRSTSNRLPRNGILCGELLLRRTPPWLPMCPTTSSSTAGPLACGTRARGDTDRDRVATTRRADLEAAVDQVKVKSSFGSARPFRSNGLGARVRVGRFSQY